MRVCVVKNGPLDYSETFIRQHAADLPAETLLVDEWPPWLRLGPPWKASLPGRACSRALSLLSPASYGRRVTAAYAELFARERVDLVLAEFGPTGVAVMDACRRLGLPLFVHFHGYDLSVRRVLERYGAAYRELFGRADGLFVVSRAMREKLVALGAPPTRVHVNPCGVNCELLGGAEPAQAPPVFLAVGRFVAKKAPHLTLEAFATVRREAPEVRLRMIGDGPLLRECRALASRLALESAVAFLGAQPREVVRDEMRAARCFVQHSVEAPDGDCEGTPVGVLEAGASGLPVVATRHAGIPDVVVEGETGLLVAERDVRGMAEAMLRLARDPDLAARLGRAARRHVRTHYSAARSIERLWSIIAGQNHPR